MNGINKLLPYLSLSPVASRPPSPKSDTEYENQKIDTVTPTDSNAPSWGWGELPNVPRRLSTTQIQNQAASDAQNNTEDGKTDENSAGKCNILQHFFFLKYLCY